MRRFWLSLWGYWALWLSLSSILAAGLAAGVLTAALYLFKDAPLIDEAVFTALRDIFWFTFAIAWSVTLPAASLLVVRRLFYRCLFGFQMHFLQCPSRQEIRDLHISDTIPLWRKWLLALVWGVAVQVLVIVGFRLFFTEETLMAWFNVYWLHLFILISGMLTLPLMGARCKMVNIQRC